MVLLVRLQCYVQGARHAFAESAGRNMANPTAILLCASNMLEYVGLKQHADMVRSAVTATVKARKVSYTLKSVGSEMGDQLCARKIS